MYESFSLICPICGQALKADGKSLLCRKSHCFDIAKQGYINLLPVQNKHSLSPGDTKEMLLARRRFLDSGMEGYYTSHIKTACRAECIGIDIAKEGVRMACSRNKSILWAVATASNLPIADASLDGLCAMFSLLLPEEYARVLKKGGIVTEVTVGSDHLRELKEIIYNEVFVQHKHPSPCPAQFTETLCREQQYKVTLDRSQLTDLVMMTPHFWRIKRERRDALMQTDHLTLTVHYWLRILKKR